MKATVKEIDGRQFAEIKHQFDDELYFEYLPIFGEKGLKEGQEIKVTVKTKYLTDTEGNGEIVIKYAKKAL